MNSASRVLAAVVLTSTVLGACSSGGDDADDALPAEARAGADLARSEGCMACHSADGRSSVGPTWKGLYGSEVELEDGSTVTADDEYLVRAIEDPEAERVEGFSATMPDRKLSDEEIQSIVEYIRTLS